LLVAVYRCILYVTAAGIDMDTESGMAQLVTKLANTLGEDALMSLGGGAEPPAPVEKVDEHTS
jgi:hypothetical protein